MTSDKSVQHFDDIQPIKPVYDELAARYESFHQAWDAAETSNDRMAVIRDWDRLMRELDTWDSMTQLRFSQDTINEQYKQAQGYRDELAPKLTDLAVTWKRKILQHRDEIAEAFGNQAIAIWDSDVAAFAPEIQDDLAAESKTGAEYTALTAAAKVRVRDETVNLSEVVKFREYSDRSLRQEAELARWSWFDANRDALDDLFDRLVKLRTDMAKSLGDPTFVELAYRRLLRIDYGEADVDQFRQSVAKRVTPLCSQLIEKQQATLGLDGPVMYWDESVLDPTGNPKPAGDHDWMIARAMEMFDSMGHGLGEFFRRMSTGGFMDLKNRPDKAGGGFCTTFASEGMPFIFANFNGSKGDVEVFTHEIGHAFQNYESQSVPLIDYLWPTYESCEIHSMGLEFLTWPSMGLFFEDDAERFRRVHLEQSLRFLPYGVAVDHFQHLVYKKPEASPAERHAMWQEVESIYLPWRQYGDLPHVGLGGFWQMQRHIYTAPFYYIDYTLALTCAMQLWVRAEADREATMEAYAALCRRGGTASFLDLTTSAGLRSPFEPGCLDSVVAAAESYLS